MLEENEEAKENFFLFLYYHHKHGIYFVRLVDRLYIHQCGKLLDSLLYED